ncbi:VOC family protein [Streptomyces sp. NBC_00009]|uniref:VOC family protein n=1 Tax=Streptomyces sp. NBC_00009 TaxID=2975620 RepID=UPI003245FFA3
MSPPYARPQGSATLMHVAINCPDVDESLRFYSEGLGFTRRYEWTKSSKAACPGHAVYTGRGVYIELEGETYIELFPGGTRGVDSSAGPIQHIALIVPSVDEAYTKCLASGGRPYALEDWDGAPETVVLNGTPEMEVRVAFIAGPAGELIELYEQYSPVVARQ